MKTTNNTVLITGGSAGIGFEIAKKLADLGNQVIITGRSAERLENALLSLPGAAGFVCDVTNEKEVAMLVEKIKADFPGLNVLINNAGRAYVKTLFNTGAFDKAGDEMLTNYLSVVRLNEKLLPLLSAREEAAIVNVSSIVALVPNNITATYGASKAALHSYSQSLRIVLARTSAVKVFELMPPLVNTEFSQEIGGANGLPAEVVAEDLINALANDDFEIHVGRTADIFGLLHKSPAEALSVMNPA